MTKLVTKKNTKVKIINLKKPKIKLRKHLNKKNQKKKFEQSKELLALTKTWEEDLCE